MWFGITMIIVGLLLTVAFNLINYYEDKVTFVSNKTGDKFLYLYAGEMKVGNKSISCVTFQSKEKGLVYTMEVNEFYNNFTLLKEWKQK